MFLGPYWSEDGSLLAGRCRRSLYASFVLCDGRELVISPAGGCGCRPLYVVYLAIQASTMAYFVPEQEALIAGASSIARDLLKSRADRWIFLNYFRIAGGVLAFVFLMLAALDASDSRSMRLR